MVAPTAEPYHFIIWLSPRPSRPFSPLVRESYPMHVHVWLLLKLSFGFQTVFFGMNACVRVCMHKTLAVLTWLATHRPARPKWASRIKFFNEPQVTLWVRLPSIHVYITLRLRPSRPFVLPPPSWKTSKFTHSRWVLHSTRSGICQSLCHLYRRMIPFSFHPPL